MASEKKIEIIFKSRVKHNGKRYEAGTKIKVNAAEKERWLKAGAKVVSIDEVATGADGKQEPVNESTGDEGKDGKQE